jgi:hypothetical protein
MRRFVAIAALTCATLFAACERPTHPLQSAEGSRPAQNGGGLTVTISGDSWVSQAETSYFTASVSGGNGNYTYTWYMQSCNEYPLDEEWCESDPYPGWPHTNGVSGNTAWRWRGIYDLRMTVSVYVAEVGGTKTGSGVFYQWGPNSL